MGIFAKMHVRKNLRFVNREDAFHALQFEEESAFDEKIHAVAAVQQDTFVFDRQR